MRIVDTKLSMSTASTLRRMAKQRKQTQLWSASSEHIHLTSNEALSLAEFACNASRQQSIEASPFEVDIGYIPRMPPGAMAATTGSRRSPRGHPPTTDGLGFAVFMAGTHRQLHISFQRHRNSRQQKQTSTGVHTHFRKVTRYWCPRKTCPSHMPPELATTVKHCTTKT